MYRSGMTGLGLMQTTASGVSFTSGVPSCISAAEKAEANAKCPTMRTLRGLGAGTRADAPMSGRLAAISPCALADLPVCPIPRCIDEATAGLIAQCIAGTNTNPDFDCSPFMVAALAQLPYCGSMSFLAPLPKCIDANTAALRSYCKSTGGQGSNKAWNGICWAAMHDPVYWAQSLAVPECHAPAMRDPTPRRAPVVTAPPVVADQPVFMPSPDDMQLEPKKTEAGMAGMWGILALVAVAGGGYYMYRRNKK